MIEEQAVRYRKRLNNNVVVAVDEQGEEHVLFGRGLGFELTVDGAVDMQRVERVYVLKEGSIPPLPGWSGAPAPAEYLEIAEQIFADAREAIPVDISASIIAPLADHISIAVHKERQGFGIKNMMLQEVQRFYRDEFLVGRRAVELVNNRFEVGLDDGAAAQALLPLVQRAHRIQRGGSGSLTRRQRCWLPGG
ncbi:PRD domain-containing protein [Actinomyces bowdenii]|uniref:CAT RNA binding domain-containing protein n=1 Tax=Actinomyces bowdenii TaxID=131109 RepID=UPI001ABBEC99|nr:CAT RNA binding domain-containing protein [Actinomyces bowdenii]MBO3724692.1 PRD domain-containing protein [Actinomyces bowdenii]